MISADSTEIVCHAKLNSRTENSSCYWYGLVLLLLASSFWLGKLDSPHDGTGGNSYSLRFPFSGCWNWAGICMFSSRFMLNKCVDRP